MISQGSGETVGEGACGQARRSELDLRDWHRKPWKGVLRLLYVYTCLLLNKFNYMGAAGGRNCVWHYVDPVILKTHRRSTHLCLLGAGMRGMNC